MSVVSFSAVTGDSIIPYDQMPDDMISTFRTAATERDVPLIATIFDDSVAGTMAATIADPASSLGARAADRVVGDQRGFDGVDLDYEKFAYADDRSTWSTTRPNWIAFLTELSTALHAIGKQLIVSVPPVYDDGQTDDSGYWVYDHAAMGPLVDRIRVMAYDYSYQGGEPGPIAPIDWVEQLVDTLTDDGRPGQARPGHPHIRVRLGGVGHRHMPRRPGARDAARSRPLVRPRDRPNGASRPCGTRPRPSGPTTTSTR